MNTLDEINTLDELVAHAEKQAKTGPQKKLNAKKNNSPAMSDEVRKIVQMDGV